MNKNFTRIILIFLNFWYICCFIQDANFGGGCSSDKRFIYKTTIYSWTEPYTEMFLAPIDSFECNSNLWIYKKLSFLANKIANFYIYEDLAPNPDKYLYYKVLYSKDATTLKNNTFYNKNGELIQNTIYLEGLVDWKTSSSLNFDFWDTHSTYGIDIHNVNLSGSIKSENHRIYFEAQKISTPAFELRNYRLLNTTNGGIKVKVYQADLSKDYTLSLDGTTLWQSQEGVKQISYKLNNEQVKQVDGYIWKSNPDWETQINKNEIQTIFSSNQDYTGPFF